MILSYKHAKLLQKFGLRKKKRCLTALFVVVSCIIKKKTLILQSENIGTSVNENKFMLKDILSVSGKPGLYRLVSRGNNMLIIQSLIDGKRIPTYARDRIVSLADISMFTDDEDVKLHEVLESAYKLEEGKAVAWDIKKADNKQLGEWFAKVLPNYDRDRVYPSDIRKLAQWYNILIAAGFTTFKPEEDKDDEKA